MAKPADEVEAAWLEWVKTDRPNIGNFSAFDAGYRAARTRYEPKPVCNYPRCGGRVYNPCHDRCETIIRNAFMASAFDRNNNPIPHEEQQRRFLELMDDQRVTDGMVEGPHQRP